MTSPNRADRRSGKTGFSTAGAWADRSLCVAAALLFTAGPIAMVGCEEGGMEEAGENIDDAYDEAGDNIEDAVN